MPDLSPDTIRNGLAGTAQRASRATKQWARGIATRAQDEGYPSFKQFGGGQADPLRPVESVFEHAVVSAPGILTGIGSGILTGISRPVASVTDAYQVSKIEQLQSDFLIKHDQDLRQLGEDLSQAKLNMRKLANMLGEANVSPSKLNQIMRDKIYCGSHERMRIQDALDRAKTPEERQKLQAMKDDMDKWTAQRDGRLKAESPAVDELRMKTGKISDQIDRQRGWMQDAADSPGPTNLIGSPTKDRPYSHMLESSHIQPDAIMHTNSLHDFLLRSRALIND